jgi:polygalacturonase
VKNQIKIVILIALTGSVLSCNKQVGKTYSYAYLYQDLPIELPMVTYPEFPERQVSIVDFGGKGDGQFKNTQAFEKAMEALSEKGGGTLLVPPGVWLTGPIVFRSNINLFIDKGALILFSRDFDDYPLVETFFEGLNTKRCQSPVSGRNLKNIAITGQGSIDGSGDAWRPVKKEKVTENHWKKIISKGGAFKRDDYWFPTKKSLKGDAISDMNVPRNLKTDKEWDEVKDFLRPVMISFIKCENILLKGVTFSNSPSWNLHPLMCRNVIIDNVHVKNPSYAQNGDGLDLESCENALVVNSRFDVGDDGICIKSGKDEEGRKRAMPTRNVIIDNCKVFNGHGGFVVGSEMSGGVKNIVVRNCSFLGTDTGLRFKSRRGRGGVVENIYVSDIIMDNISTDALLFNLFYNGKSASESLNDGDAVAPGKETIPTVTEETPVFRNLFFDRITSTNARRAMFFNGLPEMNISNIHLKNISVTSTLGAEFAESDGITLENVTVVPRQGAALILNNVKNMQIGDFNYPDTLSHVAVLSGKHSGTIQGLVQSVEHDKIRCLKDFDGELLK